jgi:hypothetical protein
LEKGFERVSRVISAFLRERIRKDLRGKIRDGLKDLLQARLLLPTPAYT